MQSDVSKARGQGRENTLIGQTVHFTQQLGPGDLEGGLRRQGGCVWPWRGRLYFSCEDRRCSASPRRLSSSWCSSARYRPTGTASRPCSSPNRQPAMAPVAPLSPGRDGTLRAAPWSPPPAPHPLARGLSRLSPCPDLGRSPVRARGVPSRSWDGCTPGVQRSSQPGAQHSGDSLEGVMPPQRPSPADLASQPPPPYPPEAPGRCPLLPSVCPGRHCWAPLGARRGPLVLGRQVLLPAGGPWAAPHLRGTWHGGTAPSSCPWLPGGRRRRSWGRHGPAGPRGPQSSISCRSWEGAMGQGPGLGHAEGLGAQLLARPCADVSPCVQALPPAAVDSGLERPAPQPLTPRSSRRPRQRIL